MSNIDFLVKLREAAQMIVDVTNEQLEEMAPVEVKYDKKDFDGLKWETKDGTKGEYQQTSKEANQKKQ